MYLVLFKRMLKLAACVRMCVSVCMCDSCLVFTLVCKKMYTLITVEP